MPAGDFTRFRPAALTFFRELSRHNERVWFEAHRHVYDAEVLLPLRALVEEMDDRLAGLAPELVGDPKRSIFRIHRDVRFSRDKSPYKTNAACWFYHRDAGRGVGSSAHGGAGLYFQLGPNACMVGGGIWMPPRDELRTLREAIARGPRTFERTLVAPAFRRTYGTLDKEAMLTRLPRGFAPDHPAGTWLRYQSFTASRSLSHGEVTGATLPRLLAAHFKALIPLVRWLNSALGYAPATRRD